MTQKKQTESIHDKDYDRWGDMPGGNYIHVIPHAKGKSVPQKKEK